MAPLERDQFATPETIRLNPRRALAVAKTSLVLAFARIGFAPCDPLFDRAMISRFRRKGSGDYGTVMASFERGSSDVGSRHRLGDAEDHVKAWRFDR